MALGISRSPSRTNKEFLSDQASQSSCPSSLHCPQLSSFTCSYSAPCLGFRAGATSAALILLLHHPLALLHWRLDNCSWQRMGRGEDGSAVPGEEERMALLPLPCGDPCCAVEHPLATVAATAQPREGKLQVSAPTGAPAALAAQLKD